MSAEAALSRPLSPVSPPAAPACHGTAKNHEGWDGMAAPPGSHLPMTAFGSVPKAQMQGEPEGTWNLEKLHLELKYFGRKLADAKLQGQGGNE